jgi:beta-glucosidase
VQLYVRDVVASVTRPVKELKGFSRVTLEPGETRTIAFDVTPDRLACYDVDMRFRVEPGEFRLMVGTSSRDSDLTTVTLVVEDEPARSAKEPRG